MSQDQDGGLVVSLPQNDAEIVVLADKLQKPIWKALLDRLDEDGAFLLGLYQSLSIYSDLVTGQLAQGPDLAMDELRETMKKTLSKALKRAGTLGLLNVNAGSSSTQKTNMTGLVDLVGLEPTTPTMPMKEAD
jgi:hypothetical protein